MPHLLSYQMDWNFLGESFSSLWGQESDIPFGEGLMAQQLLRFIHQSKICIVHPQPSVLSIESDE